MPQRILVLCYHNLVRETLPRAELQAALAMPVARFSAHLDYLVRRYRPGMLDGEDCSKDESQRRVILTFDDGYRSILTLALPLLRQRRIPAYVFVNPGYVGGWNPRDLLMALVLYGSDRSVKALGSVLGIFRLPRSREQAFLVARAAMWAALGRRGKSVYDDVLDVFTRHADDRLRERLQRSRLLSWEDLRSLREQGIRVGNHTHRHLELEGLSRSTVKSEITEAQRLLVSQIGTDEGVIAYPRGRADITTEEEAARAGYRWGLTTVPGFLSGETPTLRAPRVSISPTDGLSVLAWKTSPLRFWARRRQTADLLREHRRRRLHVILGGERPRRDSSPRATL